MLVLPNKRGVCRVEDDFTGKDTPDPLLCIQCLQVLRFAMAGQVLGELCKSRMGQSVNTVLNPRTDPRA